MNYEIEQNIEKYKNKLKELKKIIKIDDIKNKIDELEKQMSDQKFWDDKEKANQVIQELKSNKEIYQEFNKIDDEFKNILELYTLTKEAEDEELIKEVEENIQNIIKEIEKLEIKSLLNNPLDHKNCILSIHPGAGGTESHDWAQMLMRMYVRWCEKNNYKVNILDLLPGEEAGIKSVTMEIIGPYAYGYLKSEIGVHRLVRISPFDANKRRHTSFASVSVLPELDENIEIEINEKDIKIDTYRASGAGGQHVNRTDSAVRITHLPTGIVVQCQSERSQHQNKENAFKILKAKLYQIKLEEERKKREELAGEKKKIEWGSQIRSYVFMPYTLAKDHRTGAEHTNIQAVMDGDIDIFIESYLKYISK